MVDTLLKRAPKNPALFIACNVGVVLTWGACMGTVRRARQSKASSGEYAVGFRKWFVLSRASALRFSKSCVLTARRITED
jgi:hypothetical protein